MSFVYEENECSLVVLSAGAQDGGVYTCTARNLAGEVSCKAELAVHSGALELKGSKAECSPRDPMMWARASPPDRESLARPSLQTTPSSSPSSSNRASLLCLPAALPGRVSALSLILSSPPNARHLFLSSDSYGGGRDRGRRGAARKEAQRLL